MKAFASLAAAFFLSVPLAHAQDPAANFPSRPIRIFGQGMGSTADYLSRYLAQRLQERWGQPVIVDSRAGAGGTIPADAVAKSAPDGYNLVMGHAGPFVSAITLYAKTLPYDPLKDFEPIWGVSLGGYYAPRAAAFERRIKACVSLSGPFARSASFAGRPSINVETFRVRSKSANLEEAGKVALRMSLEGVAKNIKCPIYIVAGTKDRLTPHTEAQRLAAAVSGPCVLSVIDGGNHVVNNLWYRYRDQTADWMATRLERS